MFSHRFCAQNISVEMKIIVISSEFDFSDIKQKMRDVFVKMRERRQNARFRARLRDG